MHGLRIGLLTASASRLGGGVFEAVVRQAALIRELGGEPSIFALRDACSEADAGRFEGASLAHFGVRGPAQVGFAPRLPGALLAADLDVLHLHGIWMYPSRAATLWARASGKPYLISPHGMLDPATVKRRPWKKSAGRLLYERASWRAASAFHALTATEADNVRAAAGPVPLFTIPNAGPPPQAPREAMPDPIAVYIGRIHAIKNLAALIEAWRMAQLPADARLEVAGWGEAVDVERFERLVAAAGPRVSYLGPVFGEAKVALLERARFVVLPSLSEAMPMTVLEAWAAGVPGVLSSACNLPEGFAAGAALDCGLCPADIARCLEVAFAQDEPSWRAMSQAALDLAGGPFSSESVAARWATAYRGEARSG